MRKQLFAIASSVALAVAMSAPAGAFQLSPGAGIAQDTNVIHVRDRGDSGGRSGNVGNFSGGRSGSSGPGVSARGNFSGPSVRGNFSAPSARGNFEPRGQVQSRDFSRGKFQSNEARGQVQTQRRDFDRSDYSRRESRHSGDFSRWQGNKPHLAHRGWDRHHKHRFFGAFLIGVPYGYYAISGNPCYDWFYGPEGWGYYWNYDRCPV